MLTRKRIRDIIRRSMRQKDELSGNSNSHGNPHDMRDCMDVKGHDREQRKEVQSDSRRGREPQESAGRESSEAVRVLHPVYEEPSGQEVSPVYTIREHELIIEGTEIQLMEIADALRGSDRISNTVSDLVFSIDYLFGYDGIIE